MKEVKKTELISLWETNHWDGTMDGFCTYNGSPFYFETVEDTDAFRKALLYPISLKDFEIHKQVNQDFRELVGEHWDMNSDWSYVNRQAKPKLTANLFYEKWGHAGKEGQMKEPDPKKNPPEMYFYLYRYS